MFQDIWEITFFNTIIKEFSEVALKYVGVLLFYFQWDINALNNNSFEFSVLVSLTTSFSDTPEDLNVFPLLTACLWFSR